tara:strand:- start:1376 stop:1906 length:531 start_codon:yes stop_codon:yes gene_type:complete
MVQDSMETNKLIGVIQPKKSILNSDEDLHEVGCLAKIVNFNEAPDGRFLIELNGLTRFKTTNEIKNNKLYREYEVEFDQFKNDLNLEKEKIKPSDLKLIFNDLKLLFEKRGYIINWKLLEKQNLDEAINALSMTSPFSIEEKQILLESLSLESRKNKISEILSTYVFDDFNNTTLQ